MKKISLIALVLLGPALTAVGLKAASLDGLQVFTEQEYVRIVFDLQGGERPVVEPQPRGELVFVRFEDTDISALGRQSFLYDNNPHIESITFLPLAGGATVARVKARRPFILRTWDIGSPPRLVLELSTSSQTETAPTPSPVQAPVTAPVQVPAAGPDYYSQGLGQMRQGNMNAALISFRNAIRAGKNAPESYYHAGLIRYRQNQPEMAGVNLERALDSGQYAHEARLFLAAIAYSSGNREDFRRRWNGFTAAVPDPAHRLELAGTHPEIDYRAMETAARDAGLVAGPEPGIVAALSQDRPRSTNPDSADAWFRRGMEDRRERRFQEAATSFRRVLEHDPRHSEACFQLGIVYKELGQPEESAAWFERSLGSGSFRGAAEARETVEPLDAEPAIGVSPLGLFEQDEAGDDGFDIEGAAAGTGFDSSPPGNARAEAIVSESAGLMRTDVSQSAAAEPAAPTGLIARGRQLMRSFVAQTGIDLLRRQVKILTVIMGLILMLTLIGERLATGRFGFSLLPFGGKGAGVPSDAGNGGGGEDITEKKKVQAVEMVERRRQLAHVMARELASKQKAVPAAHPRESLALGEGKTIDLRLGRNNGAPVYGADIAKRIKEKLASPPQDETMTSFFGRGRDDVRTRLIRQLRVKGWTVSDIAQEMGLSREEVKWALTSGQDSAVREHAEPVSARAASGQARDLLAKRSARAQMSREERVINREVDLELQINV